jgi:hypothetical protein
LPSLARRDTNIPSSVPLEREVCSIMAMEWATPNNSKRQVNDAARKLLRPWREVGANTYLEALDIVNNWRASHSFPLNTFQVYLRKRGRDVGGTCLVAQRIKRMSSIMAKLHRFPRMTLSQMQDIGGCRAILQTAQRVEQLCAIYEASRGLHEPQRRDDYIAAPRDSGYRGVHLIYRYQSKAKPEYNSLLIEIQLRTRLQHAWATAVETVGMFVGQALKSSLGEEEWLRFFALMGTAIASFEDRPPVPNTPMQQNELVDELRHHATMLDVINRLEGYRTALQVLGQQEEKTDHYFLIELDPTTNIVRLRGFRREESERATAAYLEIEKTIAEKAGADAVLVSVDSLASLYRAYPNYFADTRVFLNVVNQTLMGRKTLKAIQEPQT